MCLLIYFNIFSIAFFGSIQAQRSFDDNSIDPDLLLDLDVLLKKHGYPVETHEIKTDDGYLLTIFRLPHGKNGSGVNPRPILMMHGMFGTAYNFVYTEYFNMSKAGYFADHGYDVWLGNARGTTYGRKHVKLHPKNADFWKFSYHDIGLHDLPATVDYILNVTGRNSLFYIGHSQGGTIFYVLASLRPEYQKKFAQVSLTAPAGFMAHYQMTRIKAVSRHHRTLYELALKTNNMEFPPSWLNFPGILSSLCVGTVMESFCQRAFINFNGEDSGELDMKIFPMLIHSLTTTSVMQNLHYAQNINAEKFRQWDHGKEKNLEIYGQAEPPEYPVEKIEVPVRIYYGCNDKMAAEGDQEEMCRVLKNCTTHKMGNPKWNHFDFLFSKNFEKVLFEPMIKHIDTYELS
ncbi:lipase 1-like isoform X2 [Coccinella septempunctata]|uniref:lipase 1-like isoform X2 n=1 Tax=Coccinella septempunctata TaxID=41139 RepID=UPI001D075905|nr:lipase 1-like isoform X2 [Coccinella septempunctata]